MPRPNVDLDTIRDLDDVLNEHTKVPAHELTFQMKIETLLEIVNDQEQRIDKLKPGV